MHHLGEEEEEEEEEEEDLFVFNDTIEGPIISLRKLSGLTRVGALEAR